VRLLASFCMKSCSAIVMEGPLSASLMVEDMCPSLMTKGEPQPSKWARRGSPSSHHPGIVTNGRSLQGHGIYVPPCVLAALERAPGFKGERKRRLMLS
jgi:hypothetical protein